MKRQNNRQDATSTERQDNKLSAEELQQANGGFGWPLPPIPTLPPLPGLPPIYMG